ncbi:MAG TPA: hypothetical protein VFJ58_04505 [Armatimonadota bacterium]|nr:hypothetical protein [Armatimonadota bacterium]
MTDSAGISDQPLHYRVGPERLLREGMLKTGATQSAGAERGVPA